MISQCLLFSIDDVSMSSSSSLKSHSDNELPINPTRTKREEVWSEYEGDVSNNENSLTSEKSDKARNMLTYTESLARINESKSAIIRISSLKKHVRPKRHPHPPSRPKHKHRHPINMTMTGLC